MAKRGRPKLIDVLRFPCGKPKQAQSSVDPDQAPPSASTAGQRGIFNAACFHGGGHGNQCSDMIGMLWLCGYLEGASDGDGTAIEGKELLRAGREWFDARSTVLGEMGVRAGKLEQAARSTGTALPKRTRADRMYQRYSLNLDSARPQDRETLVDLMERGAECIWAGRIVSAYVGQKAFRFVGLYGAGVPSGVEFDRLASVKRALVALHTGALARAA